MKQIVTLIHLYIKKYVKPLFIVTLMLLCFTGMYMGAKTIFQWTSEELENYHEKAYMFVFKDKDTVPYKQFAGHYVSAYFNPDRKVVFNTEVPVFHRIEVVGFPDFAAINMDSSNPWEAFDFYMTETGFYQGMAGQLKNAAQNWEEEVENKIAHISVDKESYALPMNRILVVYDEKAYRSSMRNGSDSVVYSGVPRTSLNALYQLNPQGDARGTVPVIFSLQEDLFSIISGGWIIYLLLILFFIRNYFRPQSGSVGYIKNLPVGDLSVCTARFIFSFLFPLAFALIYTAGSLILNSLCNLFLLGGDIGNVGFFFIDNTARIFSTLFLWTGQMLTYNIFFIFLFYAGFIILFSILIKRVVPFVLASAAGLFISYYLFMRFNYEMFDFYFMKTSFLMNIFYYDPLRQLELVNSFIGDYGGDTLAVSFFSANQPGWWILAFAFLTGCFFLGYRIYKKREI